MRQRRDNGLDAGATGVRLMRSSTFLVVLACFASLVGCGGSSPARDPAREARVVADLNAYCRQLRTFSPAASAQQVEALSARGKTLQQEVLSASAYLPAGRDLGKALAASDSLRSELRKGTSKLRAEGVDVLERAYRLRLRIYDDTRALGIRCPGLRPRPPISG